MEKFQIIAATMQRERLMRYMPAANNDIAFAFKYYLWNCKLCESFHIVLHFSEIVSRNALANALHRRLGPEWFTDRTLIGLLAPRHQAELNDAIFGERAQHGKRMTAHHVVSALPFGFWEHLATKRFERLIWSAGVRTIFPNAPKEATFETVQGLMESVRRWRNRVAHHRAIFDKNPMRKHQDALDLIKWVCSDTGTWVASMSLFPIALTLRPKAR